MTLSHGTLEGSQMYGLLGAVLILARLGGAPVFCAAIWAKVTLLADAWSKPAADRRLAIAHHVVRKAQTRRQNKGRLMVESARCAVDPKHLHSRCRIARVRNKAPDGSVRGGCACKRVLRHKSIGGVGACRGASRTSRNVNPRYGRPGIFIRIKVDKRVVDIDLRRLVIEAQPDI